MHTGHRAALVIDKVQIKHGRYNNKDSGTGANWCRLKPRAWQEIESSEQRTKNQSKSKFSPPHEPPHV
jgi:hypothetical protein